MPSVAHIPGSFPAHQFPAVAFIAGSLTASNRSICVDYKADWRKLWSKG